SHAQHNFHLEFVQEWQVAINIFFQDLCDCFFDNNPDIAQLTKVTSQHLKSHDLNEGTGTPYTPDALPLVEAQKAKETTFSQALPSDCKDHKAHEDCWFLGKFSGTEVPGFGISKPGAAEGAITGLAFHLEGEHFLRPHTAPEPSSLLLLV